MCKWFRKCFPLPLKCLINMLLFIIHLGWAFHRWLLLLVYRFVWDHHWDVSCESGSPRLNSQSDLAFTIMPHYCKRSLHDERQPYAALHKQWLLWLDDATMDYWNSTLCLTASNDVLSPWKWYLPERVQGRACLLRLSSDVVPLPLQCQTTIKLLLMRKLTHFQNN